MKNEVVAVDNFIENELLTKNDVCCYDIERSHFMITKFMSKYKRLKFKSFKEPQIKVTTKYKYIFVDESAMGTNQYTNLDNYIDSKSEYIDLSKKIILITDMMTEEEKAYFTIALFNGKSDTTAYKEIGCSNRGLIPIKASCIVKFACAFNIEIYKGDTLPDEIDEVSFQSLKNEM